MAIYDLIVLKDAEFADVHDHGLVLAHSSLAAFDAAAPAATTLPMAALSDAVEDLDGAI